MASSAPCPTSGAHDGAAWSPRHFSLLLHLCCQWHVQLFSGLGSSLCLLLSLWTSYGLSISNIFGLCGYSGNFRASHSSLWGQSVPVTHCLTLTAFWNLRYTSLYGPLTSLFSCIQNQYPVVYIAKFCYKVQRFPWPSRPQF